MNNFICKISGGMITLIIVDIILVLFIAAVICFIVLKNKRGTQSQSSTHPSAPEPLSQNDMPEQKAQPESLGDKATNLPNFLSPNVENAENVTDPEYVIEESNALRSDAPHRTYDNMVEHFTNQITNISEEATTELKSKVTFTPRTNPEPPKRVVKDETLNLSEKKDAPIKASSFEDSTSFLSTIKEQQSAEKAKKAEKANTTKKPTTKSSTNKTSATKTASDETKPKRKYTKRK